MRYSIDMVFIFVISLSMYRIVGFKIYIPLFVLLMTDVLLARNLANTGTYADVNQLSGASVGWFALRGCTCRWLLKVYFSWLYGLYTR